jgi:hypothetical protein
LQANFSSGDAAPLVALNLTSQPVMASPSN